MYLLFIIIEIEIFRVSKILFIGFVIEPSYKLYYYNPNESLPNYMEYLDLKKMMLTMQCHKIMCGFTLLCLNFRGKNQLARHLSSPKLLKYLDLFIFSKLNQIYIMLP